MSSHCFSGNIIIPLSSFSRIGGVDPAYVPTWEYKIDLVFEGSVDLN